MSDRSGVFHLGGGNMGATPTDGEVGEEMVPRLARVDPCVDPEHNFWC